MVRLWLLICASVCALSLMAAEVDEGMLYVEFRLDPSEAWAKDIPRKVWVARDKYMRTDEPPDSVGRLHLSIIVAEPDCWMINRFENRAMHIVDPGPTFVVVPTILGSHPIGISGNLEFGRELAFFEANKATTLPDTTLWDVACSRLQTEVDSASLTLYLDKETSYPKMITMIRLGKTVKVIYDKYQPGLPVDSTLFRPPDGVNIVEQR